MKFDIELGSSVGVAVRDLDPVLDLYTEGIGLGPFDIEEIDAPDAMFRGQPAPARMRVASAPLGVCEMELIEVIAGRPPHAEFLEEHGEGMNHFNLDKQTHEEYLGTLGRLYFRGIEPFWGLPYNSFCYVESESIGGIPFEIMVGSGHAGKKGHNHLGLVVADTERTIDSYSMTMGLGPFRTADFPMPRGFYRDERIACSFRASFCDIGAARLRLYQVLEGETPYSEQIRRHGEGMHHLCLNVASLQDSLAVLADGGIEATWTCPALGTALLDTTAVGGMTFAISETPTT